MSVSYSREAMEAYVKRVAALRENAEAALHKVNQRLYSTSLYPGTFEAGDRVRQAHVERAGEYEARLQRYVWGLEELEYCVRQHLDGWENVDSEIATEIDDIDIDSASLKLETGSPRGLWG